NRDALLRLGALSSLEIISGRLNSEGGAVRSNAQFDLKIIFGDAADKTTEAPKLRKEIERLAKDIASKRARLADDSFRAKAPAEIVRAMEATLGEREIEHGKILERLKQLE
ncbi:MAG TPA: hypothetical protein VIC00_03385, partial [Candidatus Acidoferrales bacterium]